MTEPVFDATGYIRFHLESGAIETRDGGDFVLLPKKALTAVGDPEGLARSARELGAARGERFVSAHGERLGESSGLDALASELDGALATLGFGRTVIDVRSDALLFRVRGCFDGALPEGLSAFLGSFFAGFTSAFDPSMPFDAAYLGPEVGSGEAVFFAGNADAVARVASWIRQGDNPYCAIDRLREEGGRA